MIRTRAVDLPYRMAFAGGWIDQPFVSRLNPTPPGSMVVVSLHAVQPFWERAGMATGTRNVAKKLWGTCFPDRPPAQLVRELYAAENEGRTEPSGSQDMIGLIYPGVSRLDFDADFEGGFFPRHIETNTDPDIACWLEKVIHMLPVGARPPGYNPLEKKQLEPAWVARLGQSGKDCFEAIVRRDVKALGASFNESMACWGALLPCVLVHPTIALDLPGILRKHQQRYPGAMYSGCGGGYLYIVSEDPVPGAFDVHVRIQED
jgi:hypothetical protein